MERVSMLWPLPSRLPWQLCSLRALLLCVAGCVAGLQPFRLTAAEQVSYERDIRPLLLHKCVACHGALKQEAGLRLDAGQLILKGGDTGVVVVPGDVSRGSLLERVTATDPAARMPPQGEGEALTAEQVALLSGWIAQGAAVPADEPIPEDPAQHWSFQPPVRGPVPTVSRADWVRNPVDAFVAARQEPLGLVPQAEAPREVWLRRVFLDLIGLPPTRAELQAFRQDASDAAYERVVDDLLARPEYGERWGRHWMDVWRYSDWYGSRGGNEIRYSQRHIWRWRDWIVESLNADKPYDQMVIEMLAGDEVAPADPSVLRATGFLGRNWYKFDRNVWMFDTVEHTSQAFLGLTMRCARCHDHKYDPVTQEDYYRLRAFFEPHDVRTDPVSADLSTEKDATLGPVLKQGVARVFDRQPDVPTYVFQRGDDRFPDKSRVLSPAVPAVLAGEQPQITEVRLPVSAWYPSLRPEIADGLLAAAERDVQAAEASLQQLQDQAAEFARQIAQREAAGASGELIAVEAPAACLQDSFQERSAVWKVVSGTWTWEAGRLTESSVGSFATVVADVTHPRDFRARVRYRTLQPGSYRSVGFSFDYVDQGHSQDIYTSTGDASQSVQAFHRKDGQQHYPAAGIVKTSLQVGAVTTVEIEVREQQLSLTLNGQQQLDYVLPIPRREGRFALWVHNGSAEFLEVDVRPLVPTLDDLRRSRDALQNQIALQSLRVATARETATAVAARIAAERAKYGETSATPLPELALQASRAERHVQLAQAREQVLQAEQHLQTVQRSAQPDSGETAAAAPATAAAAVQEATAKLQQATQQLQAAESALAAADGQYTPLGETWPQTSSGRRLALARWIVSPQNPRASRVAVNHIWLRHFGQALVPSVANFGLNGQPPTHPELLDWLAVEFMQNGWRMKPLHRLLVLSAVYRQSSVTRDAVANRTSDPSNQFLWHMPSRRMEAEVVRDTVLFLAGSLDRQQGGPEIPETAAQTSFRRSLYFRNTPNEKAPLLETFDMANPNECYRRQDSVVPQQALALMNSGLVLDQARRLAAQLSAEAQAEAVADAAATAPGGAEPDSAQVSAEVSLTDGAFVTAAFETILSRRPTEPERQACLAFLQQNARTVQSAQPTAFPAGGGTAQQPAAAEPNQRARENLVHVLLSHNDFVTIR